MIAQSKHTMSVRFSLDQFSPEILAAMLGPQVALAMQFSRINPHWYLEGNDE